MGSFCKFFLQTSGTPVFTLPDQLVGCSLQVPVGIPLLALHIARGSPHLLLFAAFAFQVTLALVLGVALIVEDT